MAKSSGNQFGIISDADLKKGGSGNFVRKVANMKVSRFDAIEIVATDGSEVWPAFNAVVWLRKGNTNYYIEGTGVVENYQATLNALQRIASQWRFTQ